MAVQGLGVRGLGSEDFDFGLRGLGFEGLGFKVWGV